MRTSPSIVPRDHDQDVYLVLDDFGGRMGMAWRETDPADTNLKTVIRDLLDGSMPTRSASSLSTRQRAGRATSPRKSPGNFEPAATARVGTCRTAYGTLSTASIAAGD
jgi:hypothetical protein